MRLRFILQRICPAVLLLLVSACTGLSGEVDIVATMPASSNTSTVPLPAEAPDLANGQRLYQANCTACHASNGNGQGELVLSEQVPPMPSFLDDDHMRDQSPAYYYDIITNGNLENLMPPWSNRLTEQERWDVAMYVYTLHYEPEQVELGDALLGGSTSQAFVLESDRALYSDIAAANSAFSPDETWAAVAYRRTASLQNFAASRNTDDAVIAESLPDTITITGAIRNGTDDAPVPEDIVFDLRYGSVDVGFEVLEPAAFDGQNYTFEDVPVNATDEYVIVAQYQNRLFFSEFRTGVDLVETPALPVTIYNVTDDPSVVTLRDINLTIQPLSVESLGTGLIFNQINTYENGSDQVFSLRPPDQNQTVSLLVQFPPGSILLTNNNPRYITAQDQHIVIDSSPVYPGEHTIAITYFVPYEDSAVIDLPISTAFDGMLTIDVQSEELTLESDTLTPVESASAETEAGTTRYTGRYDVSPQDVITFDLAGSVFGSANTSQDSSVLTGGAVLLLVGLVAAALATLTAVLFWRQNRTESAHDEINRLLQEREQLEREHEAGRINHDVYQQRRRTINNQLETLREPDDADDSEL